MSSRCALIIFSSGGESTVLTVAISSLEHKPMKNPCGSGTAECRKPLACILAYLLGGLLVWCGVVGLVGLLFSWSEDTFNTVIAFTRIDICACQCRCHSGHQSVHMMATSLRWCSNCSMLRLHHACRHSHFCFIITVVELQHLHESITAERSTRHVPRIPSASNDVTPYTTTTYTVDQNARVQYAVVHLPPEVAPQFRRYTIEFVLPVDN